MLLRCHRGIADPEERRKRKALSAAQGRKAQAAARLLLALCARAGEGRRRVLAELYSALSCHPAVEGVSNGVRGSEAIVPRYLGVELCVPWTVSEENIEEELMYVFQHVARYRTTRP